VQVRGPGVRKVFRSGGTVSILLGDTLSSAPEIRRVKVTTAEVQSSPHVQLAKNVDKTTGDPTGSEFPVVTDGSKDVDDELYVFRPTNGLKTADQATVDDIDVEWREFTGAIPPPDITGTVIICLDGATHLWDWEFPFFV
jgi:hypothetical protein